MAPLLIPLPLCLLRRIPAGRSTSRIAPRPRSPAGPFPWQRLRLPAPLQVQCHAAPAPAPRWQAALSAAAGLYPAYVAAGGVPVVRGAGARVLHRHARLHHARHGPHAPAQGLRRLPPRQAPRHSVRVCRAVHHNACVWSDRQPRAGASPAPLSWTHPAGMLPWRNCIQRVVQVTLVAQGDVPLSIVMTVCSTLAAVFLTPLLTKILAGAYIPVDAVKLSLSTLQVVVAPIILGSSIQTAFPSVVQFVTPFAPLMAVLASSLLACSVFSENFVRLRSTIADASSVNGNFFSGDIGIVMLSVFLLHFSGFFVGYAAAAIGGFKEKQRRAISIEVGMQNSSLGVVLATAHFSSPLVALPPALSAVIMNMMGSTLGLIWQSISPSVSENETTDITDA